MTTAQTNITDAHGSWGAALAAGAIDAAAHATAAPLQLADLPPAYKVGRCVGTTCAPKRVVVAWKGSATVARARCPFCGSQVRTTTRRLSQATVVVVSPALVKVWTRQDKEAKAAKLEAKLADGHVLVKDLQPGQVVQLSWWGGAVRILEVTPEGARYSTQLVVRYELQAGGIRPGFQHNTKPARTGQGAWRKVDTAKLLEADAFEPMTDDEYQELHREATLRLTPERLERAKADVVRYQEELDRGTYLNGEPHREEHTRLTTGWRDRAAELVEELTAELAAARRSAAAEAAVEVLEALPAAEEAVAAQDALEAQEGAEEPELCDHRQPGDQHTVRVAHGYLGDAPAGTVQVLCGSCGLVLETFPPGSDPDLCLHLVQEERLEAELHGGSWPGPLPVAWDSDLLHRHQDGTEHAHAGSQGFTIGGQVIADTLGDDPHAHSTLSLTGGEPGPSTGPVVWSARLGDVAPPAVHLEDLEPQGAQPPTRA